MLLHDRDDNTVEPVNTITVKEKEERNFGDKGEKEVETLRQELRSQGQEIRQLTQEVQSMKHHKHHHHVKHHDKHNE